MKSKSLITKLVAFMLSVMMVIGCLPVGVFAANDWEGPMDDYTYPAGSQENPAYVEWVWNDAQTEATATVTVPANSTMYFQDRSISAANVLTANGETVKVTYGTPRMPSTWNIANATDADVEYTLALTYVVGAMENPYVATLYDNTVSVEAGDNDGYYLTYTADYTGTLVVTISTEAAGWSYVINNNTAYAYGDIQWSDSDPVVNPAEIEVTEGDEIQIIVNTYDPAEPNNFPGGDITVDLQYKPGSCEAFPIFLGEQVNNVTNEGTVYYQGYWAGMNVTVTGEGEFSVISEGETIAAVDGKVELSYPAVMGRPMPNLIAIVGDGEYVVSTEFPVGSINNPDVAELGDNVANITAGGSEYVWNYTAEKDGDLVITISSTTGWQYTVNNKTTYAYGDTQWSDSDPVVNPATIAVKAGDVIEIRVITYDPAAPYAAPEGTITTNLAYKEEVVLPDGEATLKFAGASLTLESSLTINFKVKPQVLDAYDDVYAVFAMKHGDEVTEITITEEDAYLLSGRYFFDFAGVAANWMNCDVTAVLYGTFEGKQYQSDVATYSVAQYCKNMLPRYQNTAGYEKFCTMLVDLLNYGALAQEYTKFETGNLVNSWLTEEQLALGTSTMPEMNSIRDMNYVTVENAKIRFRGAALVLDYAVVVRLIVNVLDGDISDYVIKVKTDREVFTIDTLEFASYRTDDGTAQYYAYFDKMYATEMSEPMEVTVYQDGVAVSNTLLYSIESYVGDNYDKSAGTPYLQELLVAMLRYGNSAEAYLG